MSKKLSTQKRNIKLDCLRILAALAVVLLHISSDYIDTFSVGSFDFNFAVILNSLTRFAVPVFVMISGELFLDSSRELSVKKLWTHNILRLAIVFVIWSYAYYVFQSLYFWKFDFYRQGIVRTVTGIVYATKHLWFIYMLIGLYVLTPILRSWLKNAEEKNIRYFLDMFFVFQILRTTFTILVNKTLTDEISKMLTITEISGYIGYYVLGYYLSKYRLSKKMTNALYVLFPIGIVLNPVIAILFSKKEGIYTPGIYDSFGIFTFAACAFLFVIFDKITKEKESNTFLSNLSKDTFGVYLVHIMIWEVIRTEIGMTAIPSSAAAILLYSALTAIISFAIAALLRRIPFIGRYLA